MKANVLSMMFFLALAACATLPDAPRPLDTGAIDREAQHLMPAMPG